MKIRICSGVAVSLALSASTMAFAQAANANSAGASLQSVPSGWQLDPGLRATVRGISAESSVRAEDETIDGDAVALVIAPSLVLTKDDTQVTFRNSATRLEYLDETRTDRWQNVARVSARIGIAEGTRFTATGERSDNLLAAEFSSADEWELGGEIEHEFGPANRIQLGASWRERSYDDADRSTGRGVRVGGEYRYRFAANQYAFLRSRYETISSDNPLREIDRVLVEASYQHPLASDLRARAEVSYQRLDFPGRTLSAGGVRQDDLFWPELTLTYSPGKWNFAAEARYVVRQSTDPDFDRSGYRFELEASHEF